MGGLFERPAVESGEQECDKAVRLDGDRAGGRGRVPDEAKDAGGLRRFDAEETARGVERQLARVGAVGTATAVAASAGAPPELMSTPTR